MAERAYDDINRDIGREIYRQAAREGVTLESLAQSADPVQRMVYRRVVEGLSKEPDENTRTQLVRRLPKEIQERVEAAYLGAYQLARDRQLMLRAVDALWVRHLTDLEALREGIGLRAYGQQNPLVAYRKEAHEMYEALLGRIQETVARTVYLLPRALLTQLGGRGQRLRATRPTVAGRASKDARGPARATQDTSRLGRNDPCWCGSGKKYKHCHMRQDMANQ
jgi:preprotein translocase subunit SecA